MSKLSDRYEKIATVTKIISNIIAVIGFGFPTIKLLLDLFVPSRAMATIGGVYQKDYEIISLFFIITTMITLMIYMFMRIFAMVIGDAGYRLNGEDTYLVDESNNEDSANFFYEKELINEDSADFFYEKGKVSKDFINENNLKRVEMRSPLHKESIVLKVIIRLILLADIIGISMEYWEIAIESLIPLIVIGTFYSFFKPRHIYVKPENVDKYY